MAMETDRLPAGSVVLAGGAASGSSTYVQRYLNSRVTVYYNPGGSSFQDTGRISYIDNSWVELVKDNGEILLAPVHSIRILKLVEKSRPNGEADQLLRAVNEEKRIERD